MRDGRDLVLTILSYYYYLDGDRAVMPATLVPACRAIGRGERPMISKDGRRITTFVNGTIVVRNLTDCNDILDTGIRGAKADFSWDGRYIAFHAPKARGAGYDIQVVDLEKRTVRTITTSLPGSSLFPSWTRDGRLSFRYDTDDFRGFVIVSDVLLARAASLPTTSDRLHGQRVWSDIFPDTPSPTARLVVVLVWGPWSAHVPDALKDLERLRADFGSRSLPVLTLVAADPSSREPDIRSMLERYGGRLARVPIQAGRLTGTEAVNQNPTTLLFRDGQLIDRRLGAQTFEELRAWIEAVLQLDESALI